MKKVTIDLVKGKEGYSLQIVGKELGYRYQGPKAWGNPYNKPTASFEVNLEDFIECLKKYAYDEEENKGTWTRLKDACGTGYNKIQCSNCKYEEAEYFTFIRNYCPNCGIRINAEIKDLEK